LKPDFSVFRFLLYYSGQVGYGFLILLGGAVSHGAVFEQVGIGRIEFYSDCKQICGFFVLALIGQPGGFVFVSFTVVDGGLKKQLS
jgi:hypothetical protein